MPYTHFGKIGDIWKHLPLCEAISAEDISCYVETNSAFPEYDLSGTAAQHYGVFNFLEKARQNSLLNSSEYYKILKLINPGERITKYLGSPGLAIEILEQKAKRFIFFDIEVESLASIRNYSRIKNIENKIELYNNDSITGLFSLSDSLDRDSFIFIDPYFIFDVDCNGRSYLDLFNHLSEKGCKCFLWYGYTTLDEKHTLNAKIRDTIKINEKQGPVCLEIIIKCIQKDFIKINPGILGCGILTANLSTHSNLKIDALCNELVNIYQGSTFEGFDGELFKEIIKN